MYLCKAEQARLFLANGEFCSDAIDSAHAEQNFTTGRTFYIIKLTRYKPSRKEPNKSEILWKKKAAGSTKKRNVF